MTLKDRIQLFFANLGLSEPPCMHHWRPASIARKPARYCDLCDKPETLTRAEFYAYFGKSFEELRANLIKP